MRCRLLAVGCVLVLAACSAGDDTSGDAEATDTGATEAEATNAPEAEATDTAEGEASAEGGTWTFLVYVVGDNDLEPFSLEDLQEMADVGSNEFLDIVVMSDRSPDYSSDGAVDQPDWEGTRLFHVQPGALVEIEDLGERNMGDGGELAAFLERGIVEFPADHYALTLWDHGGGWTGIGPDETDGGDVLELAETTAAIEQGLAAAGLEQLDYLGFDACLMATYEVASAMQPFATHMVASEELEPGHGWDYHALEVLAGGETGDGETLGRAILDGYAAQAVAMGTGADITLSLLDLAILPALDEAMGAFAESLAGQIDAIGPLVGVQRADALEFGRSPDHEGPLLSDLGEFVSEIGVESLQVADQADAVSRALGDLVLHRVNGPARTVASGLSIYFPPQPEQLDPAYTELPSAATWLTFLGAYHGAGDAIPAEAQAAFATDEPPTLELSEEGLTAYAPLDPASAASLASATLSYGFVDPSGDGSVVLLGDDEAELDADGDILSFTDLQTLTLSDGTDTIETYLSLSTDPESGLASGSIPLVYTDSEGTEQQIQLAIVFDPESGDLVEEQFFVVDESGTYGELSADPAGVLQALVPVIPPGGGEVEFVVYGDAAVFADLPAIQYGVAPLPAGTEVYVDLTVADFGGNSDAVAGTIVLE